MALALMRDTEEETGEDMTFAEMSAPAKRRRTKTAADVVCYGCKLSSRVSRMSLIILLWLCAKVALEVVDSVSRRPSQVTPKWGAVDSAGRPVDDGCWNCVMTALDVWRMPWAECRTRPGFSRA